MKWPDFNISIIGVWGGHMKPEGDYLDWKLVTSSSNSSILVTCLWLSGLSNLKVLGLTWHYVEDCSMVCTVFYISVSFFSIIL